MTQATELAGLSPGQLGLERLFWAVSDAVVVGDARSGEIVLWNPAAERLFGYTPEEAIGLPLDVLVPDALKARHRDGLARYVRTGHGPLIDGGTPIELTAVDKDGQPHLVELTLAPVTAFGTSDLMVVAIVRDVSHRKLAEDQHRRRLQVESERADVLERARRASLTAEVSTALARGATLAGALDACAIAVGQFVDGSVVRIWTLNEAKQLLELQATSGTAAATGRVHKRMRLASTDIGKIAAAGALRVVDAIPLTREWEWARRAGFMAFAGWPLLVENRCLGVLGIFAPRPLEPAVVDVVISIVDGIAQWIERKRSEDALHRSEQRFRELIERSSDLITLHSRDGKLTYVAPSIRSVLGHDGAGLIGSDLLHLVHPDDRSAVANIFTELARSRASTAATLRYRLLHTDGGWRWIEATATNLLEEPSVAAIVVNRRDVSAEVEAQQLLEKRVHERTREIGALLEAARTSSSTLDLERVVRLIMDELMKVIPCNGGSVLVIEGDELVTMANQAPVALPERPTEIRYTISDMGTTWDRLCSGETIRIPDVRADEPLAAVFRHMVRARLGALQFIRCVMWVPLLVSGRMIGLISIGGGEQNFHTEEHARLAAAFAQTVATAIENARLYQTSQSVAALKERQRLARELHDSVSQVLYAIALSAAGAEDSQRKRSAERTTQLVKQMRQLARAGLAEMRALIFELREESLAEEGLVAAITKQTAAIEARHELKVRLTLGAEPEVTLATKEALYRIVQEALHNTVKHASARTVEVSMAREGAQLAVTVRDHGRGFRTDQTFPGHLGLRSMRERAEALGGTFSATSTPRHGTTIRVEVPAGG
jgi:PAS domain S-box-containing protein